MPACADGRPGQARRNEVDTAGFRFTSPSSEERRSPLIASRRYYPGFLAALCIVALRVGIGWHFLTEGMAKYDPKPGEPQFSAEGYFRLANGPFGTYFRGVIPDANGVERFKLDEEKLPAGMKAEWSRQLAAIGGHYGFDDAQKAAGGKALADASLAADNWFRNPENYEKVRKYMATLRRTILTERDRKALSYEKERAYKDRAKLNTERRELFAVADGWTKTFHDKLDEIAGPEKVKASPYVAPMSRLDWINTLTKYGLVAAGACLILGFLTPLAAIYAAGFLLLLYLSFPPWPGVPDAPIAEGHYWIVNKNLVELLGCLVVATTPNGFWVGLDALLFGWIRRRRLRRELVAEGLIDPESDDNEGRGARGRSGQEIRSNTTTTRR